MLRPAFAGVVSKSMRSMLISFGLSPLLPGLTFGILELLEDDIFLCLTELRPPGPQSSVFQRSLVSPSASRAFKKDQPLQFG
jgi:hypothetical protein